MDKASQGDTASDRAHTRRKRMQSQARGRRRTTSPEVDGFQAPEWLDRSFVLPLTRPEVSDVPSQSMPDHDSYSEPLVHNSPAPKTHAEPTPAFVRPPSRDVDFARVIKRADRCRVANRRLRQRPQSRALPYRLPADQLTDPSAGTVLGAVGAIGALVVRLSLSNAAIPHVKR